MHSRIKREKKVVNLMISNYCSDVHKEGNLCNECIELKDYAEKRLMSCPYLANKPVCSNCTIHCYNIKQKEKIKKVMRTIGPKMLYKYPIDTIWYLFYKFTHRFQRIA